MKKIAIRSAEIPDKSSIITQRRRYSVLLGNGIRLTYSTKKDLTFCLANINRQLNVIMFELNEIYIFTFAEYRRIWYYLSSDRASIERHISDLHADINRAFRMLAERSGWANGNVFSYKYLYQVIEALRSEIDLMASVRKNKKQYIEFNLLQSKLRTMDKIKNDLENMSVDARYAASANQ